MDLIIILFIGVKINYGYRLNNSPLYSLNFHGGQKKERTLAPWTSCWSYGSENKSASTSESWAAAAFGNGTGLARLRRRGGKGNPTTMRPSLSSKSIFHDFSVISLVVLGACKFQKVIEWADRKWPGNTWFSPWFQYGLEFSNLFFPGCTIRTL